MKPIFTGNDDFRKSAFLNWRTSKHEDIGNLFALAEGILCSAIKLANFCLDDNADKKADMLIFPILTNANHGIEIYLKGLLWTLNELLGDNRKIEGGHNIKKILQAVKAKIKRYKGDSSLDFFNEQTEDLNSYINELYIIIKATEQDDRIDFSRYSVTKDKRDNHFYVDENGNVEIDLENFVYRFMKINESLDERTSYFFHQELKQQW